MTPIRAIYRDGVFRPIEDVDLPDGTEVVVRPSVDPVSASAAEARRRVYAILSQRYDGDDPFISQNHNEHQP